MKLTITNTAQNPTILWTMGGGFHELGSGQTVEDIEIEDGQAGAYAKQVGLKVEGYKEPKGKTTGVDTSGLTKADATTLTDATKRADTAEARVAELEGLLADTTERAENAERTIADLQADVQGVDEAEADDLRKQALGLGIKVDKRWSDDTVQRKIDEKLAE